MNASGNPALVLNADFRPLSYYPLSLCSWQDAVKSVFLNRVSVIEKYDQSVSSPTISFKLPSVIALKDYVMPQRKPAFTRFNVFLRDNFTCQYCAKKFAANDLTFEPDITSPTRLSYFCVILLLSASLTFCMITCLAA